MVTPSTDWKDALAEYIKDSDGKSEEYRYRRRRKLHEV